MAGGQAAQRVLIVELKVSLLVENGKGSHSEPQLPFVGLNCIEGGEAVAAFVLDERAVGPVQPPRQRPQRDAALLPSSSQGSAQSGFGPQRAGARLSPLIHDWLGS
jgi:hypothetical protein